MRLLRNTILSFTSAGKILELAQGKVDRFNARRFWEMKKDSSLPDLARIAVKLAALFMVVYVLVAYCIVCWRCTTLLF